EAMAAVRPVHAAPLAAAVLVGCEPADGWPGPAAAQAGRRVAVDARELEEEIGCRGDERTSVELLAPPDAPHDHPPRRVAPCEEPARDVVARGVIIRRVDRPLRLAAAQVEPGWGVIVELVGARDGAPPVAGPYA